MEKKTILFVIAVAFVSFFFYHSIDSPQITGYAVAETSPGIPAGEDVVCSDWYPIDCPVSGIQTRTCRVDFEFITQTKDCSFSENTNFAGQAFNIAFEGFDIFGLILGILIVLAIIIFIIYITLKKRNVGSVTNDSELKIKSLIDSANSNISNKNYSEAKKDYLKIRNLYPDLDDEKKKRYHQESIKIYNKLLKH